MRKRTYTALVGTESITGDDVFDSTAKRALARPDDIDIPTVGCTNTDNRDGLEPEDGLKKSLGNHTDTIPTGKISCVANTVPSLETTPLTTIHNLVGTCEIASSITPIDLEYVYRCLPNSFYDRRRCKTPLTTPIRFAFAFDFFI
jgi:hypothetical protein